MGLDRAMSISVSAIEAQRKRMEIISSNIANINTTRSIDGGPYRRRIAVFQENELSFSDELSLAEQREAHRGGGVRIAQIVEDNTPLQKVYNPSHPDADREGFVMMPNVNLSKEMVDMVEASKMYEANITAYNAGKKMVQDTLQIP